ncbi:pyruvate kinase [Desulfovibrio subterraneus]|jgi:pyruvate kinase|uniref:Pyruvate kinase n=1 Tax=Desulfovibrio subterraneus TaxID=2718620 RepID=A0A7J0BGS3_9BACT|nr:pyruvate kinase [Desulfovibrio subterraneus]WBF67165.1 pyruvate kinase [Desulfovibrio subterraneus]GFM32909.1 pyruvate kinase [Desulfovibrio subterraneus]
MRTKIIATIGPASNSPETLTRLIQNGVRIFRLNFSHGDASMFTDLIALLRALEKEHGVPLTLLQDLSGPKIRIGELREGTITLDQRDRVVLGPSGSEMVRDLPFIPFDNPPIMETLEVGDKVVLSDGVLQFVITEKLPLGAFEMECQNNGILTSRKGLALPGKPVRLPAMTDKDKRDLRDGLALGVDACALSYVQTPEDILTAKAIIREAGKNIPVVAKLERQNAVDRLEDILEVTDVVMVARGDLGVECPLPMLPAMQKRIIRACNRAAKPVIVATQMLLSMVNNPAPTRAETTDVANAVLDGADCVMLSEETAMGKFPVETVSFMVEIAKQAEEIQFEAQKVRPPDDEKGTPDFLAYSACLLAEKTQADAIVSHSMSGSSARQLSARRPRQIIYALTPDPEALRGLNFSWGVKPEGVNKALSGHLERAEYFIETCPLLPEGSNVVITAGQPKPGAKARGTNLVKIYRK